MEDLTVRDKLSSGFAEIAKAQPNETEIAEFLRVAKQTRERIHSNTVSRYEAWIASAQAEIVALTIEQTKAAWNAYFAGGAPFRHAKSRADLPDTFVLQAVLQVAATTGAIHFILEDSFSRRIFRSVSYPSPI